MSQFFPGAAGQLGGPNGSQHPATSMQQQQQMQILGQQQQFYTQPPPITQPQQQSLYPPVPNAGPSSQMMAVSGGMYGNIPPPMAPPPQAPSGMQHLLSGTPPAPQPQPAMMNGPGMGMHMNQQQQQQVHGQQQQQLQPQQPPPQDYRPLNVKDALTYLDQVKFQFSDQPDVYNRFLDIMKDFKSQAIDTPGVIERVSTLFRGHPSLIVGFNTFLPPGYKIEVTQTAAGQTYTITTPDSQYVNAYATAPQFQQQQSFQQQQQQQMTQSNNNNISVQAQNVAKKAPVEFNHAINYVNKIKNRFVGEPEIYKQFLEILRTYQNESKPISEVYAQVQMLFRGHGDLLDEFKQFLPDTSGQAARQAQMQQQQQQYQSTSAGGKRGRMAAASSQKMKQKALFPGGYGKKSRFDTSKNYAHQFGAAEEFEFFEKVKKVVGNKQSYLEFLKVLNLFNQEIIDLKLLVEKVEPFLCRVPELLDWFKVYVRYDESVQQLQQNLPQQDIVPTEPPNLDLTDAKRSGSSYRMLPADYTQPPCTGRDSLCYEVLNDQWSCHPTWASEDGGFVAHKKNQFEEALYRCEEDRYEFDLNIEANKAIIQRLEPVAKRIADMSAEEARAFKLPEGLGDGLSKTILRRVIKKIYDKDRGQEVLDSLCEHPAVAVPIVLKRLKQKDEEWRRNQREWSKIWREIDSKNFYKSLDHQGINFKNSDKKTISSKTLLTEIETAYRDSHNNVNNNNRNNHHHHHHLEYTVNNQAIMDDIKALVLAYLDRCQYPQNEQERVHKFLNKFVAQFFGVPDDLQSASRDRNTIYGNNAYYLFFRFYQITYARLLKIREAAEADSGASTAAGYHRMNNQKTAESLDLIVKREALPVDDVVEGGNIYKAFLSLVEKVFENDIDPAVFEEQARFWFGTCAYVMYTVDRLFQHLAKQLVHIVTDSGCVKLFSLYLKENAEDGGGDAHYRRKADEIVDEEENLFKIEFVFGRKVLAVELLGEEELTAGVLAETETKNSEIQWTDYIDNYVKFGQTDSRLQPSENRVFLKRTRTNPALVDNVPYESSNNLECKISVNTYKMFFVENSEDAFCRLYAADRLQKLRLAEQLNAKQRHLWLKKFLEKRANKVFGSSLAEWNRCTQKTDKWFIQGAETGASAGDGRMEVLNSEISGVACRQFVSQTAMRQ